MGCRDSLLHQQPIAVTCNALEDNHAFGPNPIRYDRPPGPGHAGAVSKPRMWLIPALLIVLGAVALLALSQTQQIALATERTAQMIARLPEQQAAAMRQNPAAGVMTPQRYWIGGAVAVRDGRHRLDHTRRADSFRQHGAGQREHPVVGLYVGMCSRCPFSCATWCRPCTSISTAR